MSISESSLSNYFVAAFGVVTSNKGSQAQQLSMVMTSISMITPKEQYIKCLQFHLAPL